MAYRVVLTDLAESDVEAVLKWIHNQRAMEPGRRWFVQLMAKLDTLEHHPDRCPLASESAIVGRDVRELLLGRRRYKYRILFEIRGRDVIILRVWHGSRNAVTREDLPG